MKDKKGIYDEVINDTLMTLGIPANHKGFDYIRDIIEYIIEYDLKVFELNKTIYRVIAFKYNKSIYSIERDIRYSIEIGYNRTKNYINDDLYKNSINYDKLKPTNKQFIKTVSNLVAYKISNKAVI